MEKEREIANKIVDEFEEFLAYKHIDIPNPDKADAENPAILYGADYYGLEDRVTDIINGEFATRYPCAAEFEKEYTHSRSICCVTPVICNSAGDAICITCENPCTTYDPPFYLYDNILEEVYGSTGDGDYMEFESIGAIHLELELNITRSKCVGEQDKETLSKLFIEGKLAFFNMSIWDVNDHHVIFPCQR